MIVDLHSHYPMHLLPRHRGPDESLRNKLAAHGVAYITVAHLFWRGVATNAPAIPFLPD